MKNLRLGITNTLGTSVMLLKTNISYASTIFSDKALHITQSSITHVDVTVTPSNDVLPYRPALSPREHMQFYTTLRTLMGKRLRLEIAYMR